MEPMDDLAAIVTLVAAGVTLITAVLEFLPANKKKGALVLSGA